MRHLPQVQNVRSAKKLISKDNILKQYILKSKLMPKNPWQTNYQHFK